MKAIETCLEILIATAVVAGAAYYAGYSVGYKDCLNALEKSAPTWIEERVTIKSILDDDAAQQADQKFFDSMVGGFKPFTPNN